MNELFKLNTDSDRITMSARDLHDFLEVDTRFNDWFPRMADYGFSEGNDYEAITQKRVTAQGNETSMSDYQITIDMAKEIAMIQRSEKGKLAREYFIQVEKDWNSPDKIMARALVMANRQISTLQLENNVMKPKALFADAVSASNTTILIGDLAKLIKQNGHDIGQNRLFQWMRDNGYLIKDGSSRNMPTQRSMDLKLFKVKERTINNPDGTVVITRTTQVLPAGQIYFINKFCGGDPDASN